MSRLPDPAAQSERVHEHPDQPLGLGVLAVGDRRADAEVVLAGIAIQQRLECREQGHVERAALLFGQALEPRGQLRVESERVAWRRQSSARPAADDRPVDRDAPERRPASLASRRAAARGRPLRSATAAARCCSRRIESAVRPTPALGHRGERRGARSSSRIRTPMDQPSLTMWCMLSRSRCSCIGEPDHLAADERTVREIERRRRIAAAQTRPPSRRARASALRSIRSSRKSSRSENALVRLPVLAREYRPEILVPLDEKIECAAPTARHRAPRGSSHAAGTL